MNIRLSSINGNTMENNRVIYISECFDRPFMKGVVAGCAFVTANVTTKEPWEKIRVLDFLIESPKLSVFDAMDIIQTFGDYFYAFVNNPLDGVGLIFMTMSNVSTKRYVVKSMIAEIERIVALSGFNDHHEKHALRTISEIMKTKQL